MTDDNKLVPTPNSGDNTSPTTDTGSTSIKIGLKTGTTGASIPLTLRQRAQQAKETSSNRRVEDNTKAITSTNRTVLMLDISGSMSSSADTHFGPDNNPTTKIVYLQRAFAKFIESVDYSTTSVAVRTFPCEASTNNVEEEELFNICSSVKHGVSLPLSTSPLTLSACLLSLTAGGGTPMNTAMKFVLESWSITRGVLISDGEATDNYGNVIVTETAPNYREAGIPIDCVHIGAETAGEVLLKQIAEITGGIYLKFTDVESFSTALQYLTPRYRAMLTSGDSRLLAKQIGASQIIVNKEK